MLVLHPARLLRTVTVASRYAECRLCRESCDIRVTERKEVWIRSWITSKKDLMPDKRLTKPLENRHLSEKQTAARGGSFLLVPGPIDILRTVVGFNE